MQGIATIMLHYNRTRLEGVQMDGQTWLRVPQIVAPLGFAQEKYVRTLYERHRDEFTQDETLLIVEHTAGGPQQVRMFSLQGVRLLAMLARTPSAAQFRRWVLDLLAGRAPLRVNVAGDLLEQIEGPPRLAAHPLVREAIATAMEARADIAAAFRNARDKQRRARKQAALAGLSSRELRILVERECWSMRHAHGTV